MIMVLALIKRLQSPVIHSTLMTMVLTLVKRLQSPVIHSILMTMVLTLVKRLQSPVIHSILMTMVLTLVKRLQKLAQYGMTKNNCSHNKTISKSLAVAGFFVCGTQL